MKSFFEFHMTETATDIRVTTGDASIEEITGLDTSKLMTGYVNLLYRLTDVIYGAREMFEEERAAEHLNAYLQELYECTARYLEPIQKAKADRQAELDGGQDPEVD